MAKITVKQLEAPTPADDGKTLREKGGLTAKVRAGVRGVTALFRYEFKMGVTPYPLARNTPASVP